MQLSVIIPTINEAGNIKVLLPRVKETLSQIVDSYEVLVVDGGSSDGTREVAANLGAKVIVQRQRGYGAALREGFRAARGAYILTMDADMSHSPVSIRDLWALREQAEIVIASRYVSGGSTETPLLRLGLSRLLNLFFRWGLSLSVRDFSNGFRLYNSAAIRSMGEGASNGYDFLEESLVLCVAAGWTIKEVPSHLAPRREGQSHANLWRAGVAFLRTFARMWRLRNSIRCADYDARAFDSRIPVQRYWQRQRYRIVTGLAAGSGLTLDVGCGSSRILGGLKHAIGVDIALNKLRYARRYGTPLVNATIYRLPFAGESFGCVVCSQVIKHLPKGQQPFVEMLRVLRKGGRLIIGTPDYGRVSWRIIEKLYAIFAPSGYAGEHITQYSRGSLIRLLESYGCRYEKARYILGSELILSFRKL